MSKPKPTVSAPTDPVAALTPPPVEGAQRFHAYDVVERRVADLVPYARNARTHSPEQVRQLAAIIKHYGWTDALLIREDNTIINGHGRLLAAERLGYETVPCVVARGWSEAQIRSFAIAHNRIAELSGWDKDMLALELLDVKALGVDVALTGFDANALRMLLPPSEDLDELVEEPEVRDEPAPPPESVAVTRPGDLWVLGEHRLLCADGSIDENIDRLLAGAKIHLVNMDPPYNVKVEPRSNNAIAAGLTSFTPEKQTHHQKLDLARNPGKAKATGPMRAKDRPLANDFVTPEEFDRLLRKWFGNASRVLEPGRSFYIWGGYANLGNYPQALAESGLFFAQAIIWVKGHPVLTRKDFMGDHEWCLYGWKEGAAHQWYGPNNVSDVWQVKKLNHTAMVHLTEKPVELAARAMRYSSKAGENVLDIFGGSGSTIIAAEQLERRGFSTEIDPLYADVIVRRWEKFASRPAVLEGDGRTFAEIEAERTAQAGGA